jgi:hypothetical protein
LKAFLLPSGALGAGPSCILQWPFGIATDWKHEDLFWAACGSDARNILRKARHAVRLNEHFEHNCGLRPSSTPARLGLSRYRPGRSPDWLKFKNPDAPAVKLEAEEDWGR